MDGGDAGLLAAAGFAAGAINAVAGGGSLVSFPALLATGQSALVANVTNSVALVPGYLGGSLAYRRELRGQSRRAVALAGTSALGAAAGAALLLVAPPSAFRAVAPYLILLACALLAAQPLATRFVAGRHDGRPGMPAAAQAGTFLATIYGGYFGAGLGIMLLAVLGAAIEDDLQRLNALKGLLSLTVAVVSAVAFAVFAPVHWSEAAVIAAASLPGGATGVRLARRLRPAALRTVVIGLGVGVAVAMLAR